MLGGGEGLLKAERRKEEEIGISNVNNFNNATNALSVKSVVSVLVSVPFSVQFSSVQFRAFCTRNAHHATLSHPLRSIFITEYVLY
jgi:hypothetical protein